MNKTTMSVIIISIILNILPMSMPKGYASEDIEKNKDDSVFQKISEVINGKYELKTVPFKKITVFQSMANGIATVVRGNEAK